MIVTYKEDGWRIITQRTHGLLAMQLAMMWKRTQRPERWAETILAVAEHDDAEVELDGEELLTPTSGPLNFDMKVFDEEHCERLHQLSVTKSRYIALLTSLHMEFLYKEQAKSDPAVKAFVRKQHKFQAKWRKELGLSVVATKNLYALLEWCDALSLILCQEQVQPEQRSIEISKGPDGTRYELYSLGAEKLTIVPWPFDEKTFKVQYEFRKISKMTFESSAEFRNCFHEARVQEKEWQFEKARAPYVTKKV